MLIQTVNYIEDDTSEAVTEVTEQVGTPLGSGLFVTPHQFVYNTYAGGGLFNLVNEGLVAVFAYDPAPPWNPLAPYGDGGFACVTKPNGAMSLWPFMTAMARICIYGTADEGLSLAAAQMVARQRALELRCGPTISFTMGCAARVGINTRLISLVTADTPNGYDDGHVLCEAQDENGEWKLFDVATDMAWKDNSGNLLSIGQIVDLGVDACVKVPLANAECGNILAEGYKGRVFWQANFATDTQRMNWYRRVYRIPGIFDPTDGLTYFTLPTGTESRESWLLSLASTFRVLTRGAWDAKFYPTI